MMILNNPRDFEFLLTSSNQEDIHILNGIIECYWNGSSKQDILDFKMIYPDQEIIFNMRGQQAQVGLTKEVAEFLKNAMLERRKNC